MRALVAFGSKRGGTQGLAVQVADGLRADGFTVDMQPADHSASIEGYDVVIVGGALYANRWHKAARAFVKRHAAELGHVPTYFFSSGPLDDSAVQRDIPPVPAVTKLMDRVDARGHATFGGRLSPHVRGFPAGAMAKKMAGDWRDARQVRQWTGQVAAELRNQPVSSRSGTNGPSRPLVLPVQ
jgi:menaquinone-dependent protoporphyrinogen oxidase